MPKEWQCFLIFCVNSTILVLGRLYILVSREKKIDSMKEAYEEVTCDDFGDKLC